MESATNNENNMSLNEFIAKYGDDVVSKICEDLCEAARYKKKNSVTILEMTKHDAINISGHACFTHDDQEFEFTFRDGNNNGTEILDFGTSVKYTSPKQETRIAVLDESRIKPQELTSARRQYQEMLPEIQEKMKAMNYDLYFSPTNEIQKHYRKWLEERTLKIEWVEV